MAGNVDHVVVIHSCEVGLLQDREGFEMQLGLRGGEVGVFHFGTGVDLQLGGVDVGVLHCEGGVELLLVGGEVKELH